MYPVSAEFLALVSDSHRITSKIEVRTNTGTLLTTVYPSSGTVRGDMTAAIRRTCEFNINPDEHNFNPDSATEFFHPLSSNELHLFRGIKFDNNSIEWVPLGVYGASDVVVSDSFDDFTMSVQGQDRAREVQRARLIDTYVIPAGTNYGTAIENYIEDRRPGRFTFSFASIVAVTPDLVFGGGGNDSDPLKHIFDMADSVAHEIYFDRVGTCILRPQPTINDASVYSVSEGDDGILLDIQKEQTNTDTFNHVGVFGEAPDETPVFGEAYDDDPVSPTYVGDPVGSGDFYSPTTLTSEYVTTEAQATELAEARLRQTLSTRLSARFTSLVNPALEVGDVITVYRERMKIPTKFVVENLVIPLGAEQPMQVILQEARA